MKERTLSIREYTRRPASAAFEASVVKSTVWPTADTANVSAKIVCVIAERTEHICTRACTLSMLSKHGAKKLTPTSEIGQFVASM